MDTVHMPWSLPSEGEAGLEQVMAEECEDCWNGVSVTGSLAQSMSMGILEEEDDAEVGNGDNHDDDTGESEGEGV